MHRTFRRSGFTLIESLIAVSIISFLVALLLPFISGTRKIARRDQLEIELKMLVQKMIDYKEVYGYWPETSDFESNTHDVRAFFERDYGFYWNEDDKSLRLPHYDYKFEIEYVDDSGYRLCATAIEPYGDGDIDLCITYDWSTDRWSVDEKANVEAVEQEMQVSRMTNYRALLGAARIAARLEDPEQAGYFLVGMQTPEVQDLVWNALNLIKEDDGSGRAEVISVGELREFAQPQAIDTPMFIEMRSTIRDMLTIQGLSDGRFDDVSVPLEELRQQPVDTSALFGTANIELLMTGMFSNAGVQDSVLEKFYVGEWAREQGETAVNRNSMRAARFELEAQRDKSILSENADLLIPLTWIASPRELPEE